MNQATKNIVLMLCLSFLFVDSSAGFAPSRIKAGIRRSTLGVPPHSRHVHWKARNVVQSSSPIATLRMLRGGAITVSTQIVAKACSGLLAFQGVSLLLAPILFVHRFYKIDVDKDSLETYLLRAIGAISIGMSVNIYLSLIRNMPAQRAMGFALLPRFLYVLKSSLIGKELEKLGGSKKFLSTNEVVMAWTTFSLLSGAGNPFVSARLFSCMAFLKGAFLVLSPVAASKKCFGIDVSREGTVCTSLHSSFSIFGLHYTFVVFRNGKIESTLQRTRQ